MSTFWDQIVWGNTLLNWLIAISIMLISWIMIRVGKRSLLIRVKKISARTDSTLDDFFVLLAERTVLPALYIIAVYSGISYLTISEKGRQALHVASLVFLVFFITRAITSTITYFINNAVSNSGQNVEKEKQSRGIVVIVNIVVWMLSLVFLINNLGYNITSVIAGLGIGGVAIALASQAILGDLFNYFVIFFDKPFEVGDFIIVDDKMGAVEYIGIKSTRIRTLSGEQLICSNTDLTNSRVHNYKRMEKRRVVFSFGVVYDTAVEKMEVIPAYVKQIIESQKATQFDRAHFSGFGDFSLNFEVVYYILSADYNLYMDQQQKIYLDLLKCFNANNIEFAFPTQTLILNGVNNSGAIHK